MKSIKIVSASLLLLISTSTYAQSTASSTGGGFQEALRELLERFGLTGTAVDNGTIIIDDLNLTGTPSVPLDGELGFLLLGAAAFGVNKLRKKNAKA